MERRDCRLQLEVLLLEHKLPIKRLFQMNARVGRQCTGL